MILDLKNGIVIHDINGRAKLIHKSILQNEVIGYKLAISILNKGAEISLVKYEKCNHHKYDILRLDITPRV